MNNTIEKIGGIFQPEFKVFPSEKPSRLRSSDAVRVVFSDWNYTTHQVERYGGFRWMCAKWLDLKEAEKTCILGFESEEGLKSEGKPYILRDILGFKGVVKYLQTPPSTLQDFKCAVKCLSDQSQSSIDDRDRLEKLLKKMQFCKEVSSQLHALGNRLRGSSGKADENEVKDMKNRINKISDLKEDCPSDLKTLVSTFSSLCKQCEHYIKHSGEESLNNLREVHRNAVECFRSECGLYVSVK